MFPLIVGLLFCCGVFGLQQDSGGKFLRHVFRRVFGRLWNALEGNPAQGQVVSVLLVLSIVLGLLWLVRRSGKVASEQPTRARTLSRRAFVAGTVAGGVTLVYGNRVGRYELGLTRRRVGIRGLPPELAGLTVVMMADLHCGPHNSQDYLRKAVELCNSCRPDLILVPGDLISYDVVYASRAAELLSSLRPGVPGGLLVSWGNHDHWQGLSDRPELLNGTGATILTGSKVLLSRARELQASVSPSGGLWVAGVDDLWTGKPNLALALSGIPESEPRLLLSHNPDVAELQPHHRVDLMVSGHTHGGQVRFPLIGAPVVPSSYGQKYAQGWVDGPGYPVFVTRGVGVGGIPVRLGVPPEVVIFELHPAGLS